VDWLRVLTWLYNVVLHVWEDHKLRTLDCGVVRGTTEQQTRENCTWRSFVICTARFYYGG
jgi:hypothetical protein